jgi:hypothetical protein
VLSNDAESFVFQVAIQNTKLKLRTNIILPAVLYGCESWSLTLREERWLQVFENSVLRTIFGPKREDVTVKWIKVQKEELNDLYSSPNTVPVIKSRRMSSAGYVAITGESRGV